MSIAYDKDIGVKAKEIADRFADSMHPKPMNARLMLSIGLALQAERERCAAIAEAWASDGGWHCDIAEKIRGGAEPNKNPEFSPVPPKDWSGA